MIVLFEKNANGKIEFTKDELEELLEKARQEGVKEGQAQKPNYIYTTPSNPSPAIPNTPYWQSPVTCGTPNQTSGGTAMSEIKLNGAPVTNGI